MCFSNTCSLANPEGVFSAMILCVRLLIRKRRFCLDLDNDSKRGIAWRDLKRGICDVCDVQIAGILQPNSAFRLELVEKLSNFRGTKYARRRRSRGYIDANAEESAGMPANPLLSPSAQHLRLHNFSATARCFFSHPFLLFSREVHRAALEFSTAGASEIQKGNSTFTQFECLRPHRWTACYRGRFLILIYKEQKERMQFLRKIKART